MDTLRVVLDDKWVALAIVRESPELYEITHRSAGLPRPVLDHDRAPAHRPALECVRRHVPHAEAFSFFASGLRHWVLVVPERPIETPLRRSAVVTVAAIVAHVYRSTLELG